MFRNEPDLYMLKYICYDYIIISTEFKNWEMKQCHNWINSYPSLFVYSVLGLSF